MGHTTAVVGLVLNLVNRRRDTRSLTVTALVSLRATTDLVRLVICCRLLSDADEPRRVR